MKLNILPLEPYCTPDWSKIQKQKLLAKNKKKPCENSRSQFCVHLLSIYCSINDEHNWLQVGFLQLERENVLFF